MFLASHIFLCVIVFLFTSCGGNEGAGRNGVTAAAGTYEIIIDATSSSGTPGHATTITLTVQ
ncbi:MAG: hypothetical protein JWO91_1118 [Acidobacteriaceae bacterium]|nr:hypothetical protein [Acidobacteriaceae bacterium]